MRKDSLGLAGQAALGTKQTVMEHFPPVESVDVKDAGATIESNETTGSRAPSRLEKGVKAWEITSKGSLRPASGPRLVSGFLGTPTISQPDAGGAPTAYSFLFDPLGSDPIPHSLEVARVDPNPPIVDLFWDAVGDTLTLSAEPNGYLDFEAVHFALDRDADLAAPTVTADASKRFTFDQVQVFADVNGGGEQEVPVAAWSVALDNATDRSAEILGTRKLQDAEPGDLAAELSFTPRDRATLRDWYDRALADDLDAIKLRMTATGAIIAGAVAFKVEVIAYLCELTEAPANVDAGTRLAAIPVKAQAALDDATGKFVTVEIVKTGATL